MRGLITNMDSLAAGPTSQGQEKQEVSAQSERRKTRKKLMQMARDMYGPIRRSRVCFCKFFCISQSEKVCMPLFELGTGKWAGEGRGDQTFIQQSPEEQSSPGPAPLQGPPEAQSWGPAFGPSRICEGAIVPGVTSFCRERRAVEGVASTPALATPGRGHLGKATWPSTPTPCPRWVAEARLLVRLCGPAKGSKRWGWGPTHKSLDSMTEPAIQ